MDTSTSKVLLGVGVGLAGGLLAWRALQPQPPLTDLVETLKKLELQAEEGSNVKELSKLQHLLGQLEADREILTNRLKSSLQENAQLKELKKKEGVLVEPDRYQAGAESAVDVVVERTMRKSKVFRVVLTGGPCAGKTTALKRLTEHFTAKGWRVYAVPEAATMLFSGGIMREELCTTEAVYQFQANMLRVMMSVEEAFLSMARASGQKSIVFCDRGTMDASAYMDDNLWQAMLDENLWTEVALRDSRYDCVVHMVSAAVDAPEFYSCDNNSTRVETIDEARDAERRLSRCWVGHPYLVVIKTQTNFEEKLQRVINVVSNRAEGKVETGYSKRKYLLKEMPHDDDFDMPYEDFDVEYTFLLNSDGSMSRLRKRGAHGSFTYTHMLHDHDETQQPVTGREYVALLANRDTTRMSVRQKQRFFVHDFKCYYIAQWISPNPGLCMMQVYSRTETTAEPVLPSFAKVDREITKNPDFKMYKLASR